MKFSPMDSRTSYLPARIGHHRYRRLQTANQERITLSMKTPSPARISHHASSIVSSLPTQASNHYSGGGSRNRWRRDHASQSSTGCGRLPGKRAAQAISDSLKLIRTISVTAPKQPASQYLEESIKISRGSPFLMSQTSIILLMH
jgi:hypothetical protein